MRTESYSLPFYFYCHHTLPTISWAICLTELISNKTFPLLLWCYFFNISARIQSSSHIHQLDGELANEQIRSVFYALSTLRTDQHHIKFKYFGYITITRCLMRAIIMLRQEPHTQMGNNPMCRTEPTHDIERNVDGWAIRQLLVILLLWVVPFPLVRPMLRVSNVPCVVTPTPTPAVTASTMATAVER